LIKRLALMAWSWGLGASLEAQTTVTVTGDPPQQGLLLWLRSDSPAIRGISNLVSEWHDVRTGPLAWFPDPTYQPLYRHVGVAGRPALRFDGGDVLYAGELMPAGSYTKVAVVTIDDFNDYNNVLSGASAHALFFGFSDRAQIYHNGTFVISDTPVNSGVPVFLVATYDATSGVGNLYQDGRWVGSGVGPPVADRSMLLGSFAWGAFLRGSIAEVLLYDRVVQVGDLSKLHGYLRRRYLHEKAPQVAFASIPRDAQLLSRAVATNQATFDVAGDVLSAGYERIVVDVDRDGSLWQSLSQPLSYTGDRAAFLLEPTLSAGLFSYDLRVELETGSDRVLVAARDHLVCGDVFLINGQSNAVAGDYWSEGLGNQSQSPWIRSFGNSYYEGSILPLDLHWDVADGESFNWHASVGSFGLRMAELLMSRYQVPIALINGAVGGTSSGQHQRNDLDPADLSTIYGRLLYRAGQASVAATARSLLWYQGESDGDQDDQYWDNFDALHSDWRTDFPALEKLYLFQIRKGCGVGFAGVREVQRRIPNRYPDVEVMSTEAAPGHDGCHFLYAGYRELGERLERLVARELYGSTDDQNIRPPNIREAKWLDANHDRILLTFRDPDDTLIFEPGVEAFFVLEDGVSVTSGQVSGNTILLSLNSPSGSPVLHYDGHVGDGPSIQNSRGVGALTFFNFVIKP